MTAAAAACCLLAGCGSGAAASSGSPGTAASSVTATASGSGTGSAAVCADVSAVRRSVSQLGQAAVSKDGAGELKARLSQVTSDLDRLATDASGWWAPQVDALKSALGKAQAAVSGLAGGSGSLPGVVTAIAGVATAAVALLSAAAASCPG